MSVNLLLSLPLSICLPISVSLSCILICLSFLLSVRLCIFTQSPLICIYFIRFYVHMRPCVRVKVCVCPYLSLSLLPSLCQVQPEHCKPLARCQTFVPVYRRMQREGFSSFEWPASEAHFKNVFANMCYFPVLDYVFIIGCADSRWCVRRGM